MASIFWQFVTQSALCLLLPTSLLLSGCGLFQRSDSVPTPSSSSTLPTPATPPQVYVPPATGLEAFRPATQSDVDRTVSIRDKFIQLYSVGNFIGAHSQIRPLASADYPISKSDVAAWRRVFINAGDVLLMQVVAAARNDKPLFDFVTNSLGFSTHKCVAAAAVAANRRWDLLVSWSACYGNNRLQRSPCAHFKRALENHVPEIGPLLSEPTGACR